MLFNRRAPFTAKVRDIEVGDVDGDGQIIPFEAGGNDIYRPGWSEMYGVPMIYGKPDTPVCKPGGMRELTPAPVHF